MPFKSNTFDFIIFSEIFEHLRIDLISAMREINRVLKPKGILMLTTPNLYSLPKIIMFNLGRGFNNPYHEFEKLNRLGHMGHIREYSTREVKQFLNNTGFRALETKYESYDKVNKRFIGPIINFIPKIISRLRSHQIIISEKT
ncbi:MAG: methyltransferase domain-containing protein [Candidatus Woesearchaeota archaeon]